MSTRASGRESPRPAALSRASLRAQIRKNAGLASSALQSGCSARSAAERWSRARSPGYRRGRMRSISTPTSPVPPTANRASPPEWLRLKKMGGGSPSLPRASRGLPYSPYSRASCSGGVGGIRPEAGASRFGRRESGPVPAPRRAARRARVRPGSAVRRPPLHRRRPGRRATGADPAPALLDGAAPGPVPRARRAAYQSGFCFHGRTCYASRGGGRNP